MGDLLLWNLFSTNYDKNSNNKPVKKIITKMSVIINYKKREETRKKCK